MVTPPWATPQELFNSSRSCRAISASSCSKRSSSKPSSVTNGISVRNFMAGRRAAPSPAAPPRGAATKGSVGVPCLGGHDGRRRRRPAGSALLNVLPACDANSSVAPFRSSSSPRRRRGACLAMLSEPSCASRPLSAPTTSVPRQSTFMSSCSTPWCAEYVSWQIAARMPRELAGRDRRADARAADEHAALGVAGADRVADLLRLVWVIDPHAVVVRAEVVDFMAQSHDLPDHGVP